jgi:hypothetical protein
MNSFDQYDEDDSPWQLTPEEEHIRRSNIAPEDDPQMWERVIRRWEGPDHNPRHMDEDLLEWVLLRHPKWIKMKVNREWFNRRCREMEARGEPVLPDSFPGLRITRNLGGQSVDQN